jgi:hypothetical protein
MQSCAQQLRNKNPNHMESGWGRAFAAIEKRIVHYMIKIAS